MSPEQVANILKDLGLNDVSENSAAQILFPGFDLFGSYNLFGIFNTIKTISIVLILIFIALIIFTIYKIIVLNKTMKEKPQLLKPVPLYSRWQEIKKHSDSLREAEWKFAIIEADNLVDGVLKKLGYSGETMGERIQFIDRHEVPSLENLWQAHRLRNRLVHEPDYKLRREEMERAVRNYETTLKELGAI